MSEKRKVEMLGASWHKVEAPIAGHFLVREPPKGKGRAIVVGFHGYAESAETHLERLLKIPGHEEDWLVSVQALHPFYRRSTGEVVASWMTKFQREDAIAENRDYVDRVIGRLREKSAGELPLVLAGFSQGAAMAYRACLSTENPPTGLVVLGGDFPPDLANLETLALPPILLGRGKEDRFYPKEQFRKDLEALKVKGAKVEDCQFEGGHEWNEEFAGRVGEFMEQVLEYRQ